jgi:transcriptional regulator with XRE-family HTH domain
MCLDMVSETRRLVIRRFYRMRRTDIGRTQLQIEALARLEAGKFWKIENGFYFPDDDERPRLARALKCNELDLPTKDATDQRVSA